MISWPSVLLVFSFALVAVPACNPDHTDCADAARAVDHTIPRPPREGPPDAKWLSQPCDKSCEELHPPPRAPYDHVTASRVTSCTPPTRQDADDDTSRLLLHCEYELTECVHVNEGDFTFK